jgi:hypothetical protein
MRRWKKRPIADVAGRPCADPMAAALSDDRVRWRVPVGFLVQSVGDGLTRRAEGAVAAVATIPVRAVLLAGPERDRGWAALLRVWPAYRAYDARAGRTLRIFRLEPHR